jgi:hypothetical protein
MLMVSNHSCGGARAAVGNVNSNASGLERAAKRYRLLAAAASLASGPLDFIFYYLMSNTPRTSKKEAYEGRMVGLLCSLILDLGSV